MDSNANPRRDSFDDVGESRASRTSHYHHHYTSTSVYFEGYEADDEVFVESTGMLEGEETEDRVVEPRPRRISDVIDSVGEPSPERPWPIQNQSRVRRTSSPPVTPGGSDMGYWSTGTPPPASATTTTQLTYNHQQHFIFPHTNVPSSSSPIPSWDTPDAKPYSGGRSGGDVRMSVMPVDRDSEEYNMNHKRRGIAAIFNHDEFTSDMPERTGSHEDVNRLTSLLELLQFDVKLYSNLKCKEINETLQELAELDHSDSDCLMVIVLTHGIKNNCLYARDFLYSTETLWQPFSADKCLTLAGKPKIFIVQACRGDSLDGGVRLVSRTQTDSATNSYKIPTMADFFIAYSTAEGFYSWRDPEKGTWFIQSLCHVLAENHKEMDLQRMMTRVSKRVAIDFESHNDIYLAHNEQKQVPNMHSTLIRDVYFRQKP